MNIDELGLSKEIRELLKRRLLGPCAKHPDKAMAWISGQISEFTKVIRDDLEYFAEKVIPVGEDLDQQQKESRERKH